MTTVTQTTVAQKYPLEKGEDEQNEQKKGIICLFEEKDKDAYQQFLGEMILDGRVTFEYTLEWKEIIQKNFHFTPYYLLGKDDDGKIIGVLPLFKAVSIFGKRFVSTPYAIFTGILANDEETAKELLTFAKRLAQEHQVDFMEIREKPDSYGPSVYSPDIPSVNHVFNFSLHLSADHQEVWKKLPKGSVRWGITKARKSGMVVHSGNTPSDLDTFYHLFLQTRKIRGVPAYPYDYFKDILHSFGDDVRIYTSFFQGKAVASIFLIYHHKEVRYAFAGAAHQPEIMALQPYHLALWQAITDACEKGYTLFNFGGATLQTNDGGLYEFKKKWADTVEEVPYYYSLNKGQKIPVHDQSLLLKIASSVWAKLPVSLIKLLSPIVIRQFV
ncbi:MAG TPA: GNAT family N-acetyltransferase [Candidatus Nanoarchaeia archaeon]|nr:GNAT family N-acetyltransferase [Candidatus Nanoarchaeia archaeon]